MGKRGGRSIGASGNETKYQCSTHKGVEIKFIWMCG